jgi:hypothetical protein
VSDSAVTATGPSFTHTADAATTATPATVWALWSDVATWPTWDPAVERVSIDGAFAARATGTMTLRGGIEAPFTLEVVTPGARYLDQLTVGDLVIRIDHLVREAPGGARVTVSTSVEGPGAGDIGPMVTADAPVALAALVALAEGRA